MEKPILNDESIFPSDEVVFSHIGKKKAIWEDLFNYIKTEYPDFNTEWRFYKDGFSWLMKVTRKSKTICWISVVKGTFLMTFYFNDRAEEAILSSTIPDTLKEEFKTGKYYGKIRGLTITFKYKKDLEYAKTLIEIKRKAK